MTRQATLLERITDSSRKFESWPTERQQTALKEAQSSASYVVRAKNALADSTSHGNLKQKEQ